MPEDQIPVLPDATTVPPTAPETETAAVESPASKDAPAEAPFPIVGIGASAGGLAAFEAFFAGMPADTEPGMAFVLVQHLDPDHKSILTELIRRYTRMAVFEVWDGMVVQINCAYIIPPGRDMAFLNGALQLLEPTAPRGQRLPIDFFFRSLAQDQHEHAIGIILSGTGSDGTQGLRAIKAEGGMVMAQNPASTEYEGMPRSALSTGLVDYELPPSEMPAQLIAYVKHAFGRPPTQPATVTPPQIENALKKTLILLRAETGHDFSQYKPNTIRRRIERRMAVHRIANFDDYVRSLRQMPDELEALFRDLLIGVTSFFRDPEAFQVLEKQVIPQLFAGQHAGSVIRIWVPGCSTGEEAYSLAILLAERQQALKQSYQVQVFATDIDSRAIATARQGVYPASIAADLTPERLARFFTAEPGGNAYRVHKGLRDLLVFSEQSLIKDPPFSKLGLISCRNLLIYLDADLQKRLIPLFHYALNPGGTLFLGTSETVGEFADLFASLDRPARLYQRRENRHGLQRPDSGHFLPPQSALDAARPPVNKPIFPVKLPLRELTEQAILREVALVAALVNAQGDVLYLHGRSGLYLEPPTGVVSGVSNLLNMARVGLHHGLSVALHQAARTQATVRSPGLRVKTNGDFTTVNLTVSPLRINRAAPTEPPLYLVLLEKAEPGIAGSGEPAHSVGRVPAHGAAGGAGDAGSGEPDGSVPAPDGATPDSASDTEARIAVLQQELRAKEDFLQTTNEELETSNEELKSSNEEMQSVNEELQATNEELETSKEELQSVNEELATVNGELRSKVADLSRTNNDMTNLLAGSGIATVFVDFHLRILRFTPAATQLINLIPSDVGRPVGHLLSNLVGYDRLVADTRSVLDTLIPKEQEVQTTEGNWYLLRILPYRTVENMIEGAVITFVDITEMQRTRVALRQANDQLRLAVVVRDAHDAITVQDLTGRILAWNPSAERLYGWSEAEALAMNIRDLIAEPRRAEALAVVQRLSHAAVLEPYRMSRVAKDGRVVEVWLTATALVNPAGQVYAIATTERECGGADKSDRSDGSDGSDKSDTSDSSAPSTTTPP